MAYTFSGFRDKEGCEGRGTHHASQRARRVSLAASLVLVFVLVLAVGPAQGASAPQLLGQWHLDQLTSGSPLTTPDSSGHGLTASSTDPNVDPTTVAGRFANGLEFSGAPTGPSPQLSVPKTAVLEPQHVTLMAWVKRVDNSDLGPMWIAGKGSVCITGGLEASWALHSTAQGNISFSVYDGSNIHDSPASTAVPFDGKWHAVAGTFDGTTVRMYLDGKQVGTGTPFTGTIAYGLDDDAFKIGEKYTIQQGDTCERGSGWSGGIDEVRVYDQALAPAQVALSPGPGTGDAARPPAPTPAARRRSRSCHRCPRTFRAARWSSAARRPGSSARCSGPSARPFSQPGRDRTRSA